MFQQTLASAAFFLPWVQLKLRMLDSGILKGVFKVVYVLILLIWMFGPLTFWVSFAVHDTFFWIFSAAADVRLDRDLHGTGLDLHSFLGLGLYSGKVGVLIVYNSTICWACLLTWSRAVRVLFRTIPDSVGQSASSQPSHETSEYTTPLLIAATWSIGSPLFLVGYIVLHLTVIGFNQ